MALTTKLLGRLPVNRIISDGEVVARAPTTINTYKAPNAARHSFEKSSLHDPLGVFARWSERTAGIGVPYTVTVSFNAAVVCDRDVSALVDRIWTLTAAGEPIPAGVIIRAGGAGTHIFTPQEG